MEALIENTIAEQENKIKPNAPCIIRQAQTHRGRDSEPPRLTYQSFVQLILTHNMKQHELFISGVQQKFKELDTDNNSHLSTADQMKEFLGKIGLQDANGLYQDIIQSIDPFNHQKFNFSDILESLTNFQIPIQISQEQEPVMVTLIENFNL